MSESTLSQHEAEEPRFRVLNRAKGTIITPDVARIDTAYDTFNSVEGKFNDIAHGGVWLSPYKGVPKVSWMPDLDVAFLDEQFEVLRCIEGYQQAKMELPEIHAESAIVLPAGRLSAARIQFGDRLEFRDAATGIPLAREARSEEASEKSELYLSKSEAHKKGLKGLFGTLFGRKNEESKEVSSDRRKGKRQVIPGSVAYFAIGGPKPFEIANISTEGFYIRTKDQWAAGTSLLVGLQIVNPASREVEAAISVQSKVVRLDSEGVGFAYDDEPMHSNPRLGMTNPEQLVQLRKFLQRVQKG